PTANSVAAARRPHGRSESTRDRPGEARLGPTWCKPAGTDAATDENRRRGGLRRERRPGAAETLASPAVGQADDDRAGPRRHVDERLRVRLDQDGLGGDAERALHCDRGAREQPAGVAAVDAGRRARELERDAASACEPRAE